MLTRHCHCAKLIMSLYLGARLSQCSIRKGFPLSRRFLHSTLPSPPLVSSLTTSEHARDARRWLTQFREAGTVPKHLVELTFSRSSGPGGQVEGCICYLLLVPHILLQNVNRVATKVMARCPLNVPWIPLWAHECLMRSVCLCHICRWLLKLKSHSSLALLCKVLGLASDNIQCVSFTGSER